MPEPCGRSWPTRSPGGGSPSGGRSSTRSRRPASGSSTSGRCGRCTARVRWLSRRSATTGPRTAELVCRRFSPVWRNLQPRLTPRKLMTESAVPLLLLESLRDRSPEILRAYEEVAVQATSVSDTDDVEELLRLVGRRICELLDVNRFSAYIRGDDGLFYGKVGYCRTADIDGRIRKLVTGPDPFTAEIVATRAPVLVMDARNDPRTVQRTMREWAVRDMLGVPLVFADEAIGLIYVDNAAEDHVYTDEQIRVAQVFGSLAALAMRQAALYAQLNRRALVIDRQRRLLEEVAQAHKRLTDAALGGADVAETVRLLSDLVGKPVVFFTPDYDVAALATPLGLAPESAGAGDRTALAAVAAETQRRGATAIVPAAPHCGVVHRQLVCPLIADEESVGYLAVAEVGNSIRPLDI